MQRRGLRFYHLDIYRLGACCMAPSYVQVRMVAYLPLPPRDIDSDAVIASAHVPHRCEQRTIHRSVTVRGRRPASHTLSCMMCSALVCCHAQSLRYAARCISPRPPPLLPLRQPCSPMKSKQRHTQAAAPWSPHQQSGPTTATAHDHALREKTQHHDTR